MRCLIYAKSTNLLWMKMFFPDIDPYLLKVVNKPLLEYYLDLASILKVKDLRIVSDGSIKSIERCFGDGAKWGLNLSYALTKPEDTIKNVYLKNYSFCQDHDMLLMQGHFIALYDQKSTPLCFEPTRAISVGDEERKVIILPNGMTLKDVQPSVEAETCFSLKALSSITDYYQLSMEILKERNQSFVLPGYSSEKDTFLGINLVYPNSSKIHPPVMIGNNCRFQKFTEVGPNSIIGNNAIIDQNSIITDSIIYDNTYIGPELDIERKIVVKSNLICGITGESIFLHDRVLISEVEPGIMVSFLNRLTQRLIAVLILILQTLPWLILYLPYQLIYPQHESDHILDKSLLLGKAPDSLIIARSWYGRVLLHLNLDKYATLWRVLFSKMRLVGNQLLRNTIHHRNLVMDLPVYTPGVFSLAETVKVDNPDTQFYYEMEYIEKVSTRLNILVVIKVFIRRFFHGAN